MSEMSGCDHCDHPGGIRTFENQVSMPVNGRVQCIDHCIHRIVAALNAGGIPTIASCCGHGEMPGNIMLEDGRILVIAGGLDEIVWRSEAVKTDAMTASDLRAALRSIALALTACNNTVTTDRPDAEPGDTSWRIDHTKEIALVHELERLLLPETDSTRPQSPPPPKE